jgi:hypothetical protein
MRPKPSIRESPTWRPWREPDVKVKAADALATAEKLAQIRLEKK